MPDSRITLITGANQGIGFQVAKELVAAGNTVFIGSRDVARGQSAAANLGERAIAVQLDVTDPASIAAAAERIRGQFGRLDLLINNAAISNTSGHRLGTPEYWASALASNASIDEVKAVWNVNVFGALAVYQAMLPLLRESADARIVNVGSGAGSLATNAGTEYPYRNTFGPIYAASKAALHAMSLAMMIELEDTDIKVNIVSPGFTSTGLNDHQGIETIEQGSREVVRVALYGPNDPRGTFTRWENEHIPW